MILFAGALIAETTPLIGLLSNKKIHSKRLVHGHYKGRELAILTTGVGPQKAFSRTREALLNLPIVHVVSFGTCGSLTDSFSIGDVVTTEAVCNEKGEVLSAIPFIDVPKAKVITVTEVVNTLEKRKQLSHQADVCEMEAHGVGLAADQYCFSVVKVISDYAGREDDSILRGSFLTKPQRIAQFYVRATKLCHQKIKPVVANFMEDL